MKAIAVLGTLGVLLVVGFLTFTYSHYEECRSCHSIQDVHEWRFGFNPDSSFRVLPAQRVTHTSNIELELFPSTHEHTWEEGSFFQLNNFFGLGAGAIGCGGPPNPLVVRYENDAPFRQSIKARIASGQLTRERFLELLSLPGSKHELRSLGAHGAELDAEMNGLLQPNKTAR